MLHAAADCRGQRSAAFTPYLAVRSPFVADRDARLYLLTVRARYRHAIVV